MSKPRELSIRVGNKSILIEGDLPAKDSDNYYIEKSAYDESQRNLAEAMSGCCDCPMFKQTRKKADKLAEALDGVVQSDLCYGDAKEFARQILKECRGGKDE